MRKHIKPRKWSRRSIGKAAVKTALVLIMLLQAFLVLPPKPAAALPNPLEIANEIGREVLNQLPIERYRTLVELIVQGEHPLIRTGENFYEKLQPNMAALVCHLQTISTIPHELILEDMPERSEPCPDFQQMTADGDTQQMMSEQFVQQLAAVDGKQAIELLEQALLDFNVGTDLPNNGGKAWARKQGADLSACVWLQIGDARALLGVSNEDWLCGGKADNLANPGNVMTAFLDVTLDGYNYVFTSLPVPVAPVNTVLPKFEAVGYAPLLDDKYFKVEFGALEDASIAADFSVGVGASYDYVASLAAEAVANLSVEVKPDKLTRLVNGASKSMAEALQHIAVKGLKGQDGEALLTPEDAAAVLTAATAYVRKFEIEEPGSIGSVSIGLELKASAGVGIWDTKWPLLSGAFNLGYGIPVDRLGRLSANVLEEFIQSAIKFTDLYAQLGAAELSGERDGSDWEDAKAAINAVWQHDLLPAIQDSLGDDGGMLGDSVLETRMSLHMIGEGEGTSVEPAALSAAVPIGLVVANGLSGEFWSDTVQWLVSMAPEALKDLMYDDSPAPAFEPNNLGGIPEETVFSLKVSPLAPGLNMTAEFPAQGLLDLLQAGTVVTSTVIDGVVNSVRAASLAPLATESVKSALGALEHDIRESILFGMQLGVGASGKIGAEAEFSLGMGGELYLRSNLEMLLTLASQGALDNAAAKGNASVGMNVHLSGSLGANIGEAVEFSGSGGISASENVFALELSELDNPRVRPPHIAYVPDSADAYLTSLSLGQGLTLNEPFSPSVYKYTAHIPYEYNAPTFDIVAAPHHAGAKLSINGTPQPNGSPIPVALNASGTNQIAVRVTSADGSQTRDYMIETQRKSNTKLKTLTLGIPGAGNVNLPIGADTAFRYEIDSDVTALGISVETENAYAAATINGASTKSMGVYPTPGLNTYTITVSSVDGTVPGGVRQTTYTLQVDKRKSSHTLLEDLTIGGSYHYSGIRFSPTIGTYTKKVPANVSSIDVVPELSDLRTEGTITVNGTPVTSGNRIRVPLAYGSNPIRVQVTAENGIQYREYLVTVTREPLVRFTSLEVIGGAKLSEPFDPSKTVQKLTVTDSTKPYYFRATYASGSNRFIRYYENVDLQGEAWSGSNAPFNNLPVVMWSSTGTDWNRMPYIFVVPQANASTNADLNGLKLMTPSGELALSPAFQKSTTSYTVNVDAPAITVEPVKGDYRSTVFVNGEYRVDGKHTVFLIEGANEIPITVVAQDGTLKTYKVTVNYREPSENADLASLTCTGCVSNIADFHPDKTTYTVDVPNNSSGITVSAQAAIRNYGASQGGASVGIFHMGNMTYYADYKKGSNVLLIPRSGLAPGVNTIRVGVYSMNQHNVKVYTIKANLLPSADSALKQLKVMKEDGTTEWFGSAFTPGKLDYTLSVPANVEQALIRAWPNQADASLRVNGQLWNGYTDLPVYLAPGFNPIQVEVTAQDKSSKRTYTLNLRRTDTVPPALSLPGDLQAEAVSRDGAAVSFVVRAEDAADGAIAPICSRASGSVFAIGTTTVICSAADLDGNETTGSFTVTVTDTTPPALQGLENGQAAAGAPVVFTVTASDTVDDKPAVSCTRASGSVLPVGLTQVTCIATDFSGNASFGHFQMTVTDDEPPQWAGGSELQATRITPNAMRLYWPLATDNVAVTGYKVYRVEGVNQYLLAEVNNLTYDVTGLQENTDYTFIVSALDAAGNPSVLRLSGTFVTLETPDTQAPEWPLDTLAEAVDITDTQLTLTWTPAEDNKGVSRYRIYENDALVATRLAADLAWNGSSYAYPLDGLLPDTEYAFMIIAGDDADNWSAEGPAIAARTLESAPPVSLPPTWPAHAELTADYITENSLMLYWTPATDDTIVSRYRVYRNNILQDEVQASDLTVTGSVYGYPVTSLWPDTEYVFRVEAGDDEGNWSSDGPGVTAKTPASAPPDPDEGPEAPDAAAPTWPADAELTATAVTGTSLTLSWPSAIDDRAVTRYGMYMNDSLIRAVPVSGLTVTGSVYQYSITNLTPSTRYVFQIVAGDDALNWSPDGPTIAVTTAPAQTGPGGGTEDMDAKAPTWPSAELIVSDIRDTSLRLAWTAAQDNQEVHGYRIYVNGASAGETGGGTTWAELTGLQPSTPYMLAIAAVDAVGNWSTNGPTAIAVTLAGEVQNPPDETEEEGAAPRWPQDGVLQAADIGMYGLVLNWPQATGDPQAVTAYRIYVNGDLFTEVGTMTSSYAFAGLQSDTQYTFKIEAGDGDGRWSADGPQLTVTTLADPDAATVDRIAPDWPQDSEIVPSNITTTSMRLTWTPAVDDAAVHYYRVYRNGLVLETLPATLFSYDVTGLTAATPYIFKIEAGDEFGNWSRSGPYVSVFTKENSPPSSDTDSGGNGGPDAAPDEAQDEDAWHRIGEDELNREEGRQGESSSVLLEDDKSGVLISQTAIRLLREQGRNLEVMAHGLTVTIPPDVLADFIQSAGFAAGDDVQIGLTMVKIEKAEGDQPPDLAGDTHVEEFGVYEFEFSIVTSEGSRTAEQPFAMPLRIVIPYDPAAANEDLLGIYTFNEESRQWEYVGGTVDTDSHTISVSLSHFSKYAVLEMDRKFADVPERHWAYDALRILSAKHIVAGVSESRFAPDALTTRAEFAALLAKLLGLQAVGNADFRDVERTAWYAEAISAAYEAGLIAGRTADRFDPNATITREELAVMLVRAYTYGTGKEATRTDLAFDDRQRISSWATGYVQAAVGEQLMFGTGANRFAPLSGVTRAQAAQAVFNLLKQLP